VLTSGRICDNIVKHSKNGSKQLEKLWKKKKKCLTNGRECDIIIRLSKKGSGSRTLTSEKRLKNLKKVLDKA